MHLSKLRDRNYLLSPLLPLGLVLLTCVIFLLRIDTSPKQTDLKTAQKIFGDDVFVQYKDPIPCPQGRGTITDYCEQASTRLKDWLPQRIAYLECISCPVNQATLSEIGQLSKLEVLLLYDINLTSPPPEIRQLTELRELWLIDINLTTLPPEIGQLTKLERLRLEHNNLTTLPPEIVQLTELRWLHLHENDLATLPSEIGQLTKLEFLDLTDNPITTIPPEIEQLPDLEIYGRRLSP